MKTSGEILESVRLELGITKSELARRVDQRRQNIHNIIEGTASLSFDRLEAWLKLLGYELSVEARKV